MTSASSYPWVFQCPSFTLKPEFVLDTPEGYTRTGQAIHAILARYLATGAEPDIAHVAEQFEVDQAELDGLAERGIWIIDNVLDLQHPVVETMIEASGRRGHPDAYAVTDSRIVVPDWKSGWKVVPAKYYDQTSCYLWILREKYGRRAAYVGQIIDLRTGAVHEQRMDDADLDMWAERADRADRDAGRVYSPGDACQYCPVKHECAARQQWLEAGVNAMVATEHADLVTAAQLWPRYLAAKSAVETFEKAVRVFVAEAGQLDLGDGTHLALVPSPRDKIDPAKAWPILQAHGLDGDQIAKAMTLAKGKLLDVYSSGYGRGLKGRAKARLTDALREAGAIEVTTTRTLKAVPNTEGETL